MSVKNRKNNIIESVKSVDFKAFFHFGAGYIDKHNSDMQLL